MALVEEEDGLSHPLPSCGHFLGVIASETGHERLHSSVLIFGISHYIEEELDQFDCQGLTDETLSGQLDHLLEAFDFQDRTVQILMLIDLFLDLLHEIGESGRYIFNHAARGLHDVSIFYDSGHIMLLKV